MSGAKRNREVCVGGVAETCKMKEFLFEHSGNNGFGRQIEPGMEGSAIILFFLEFLPTIL